MKFDVFTWNEVKPNEKNKAEKGRLRLLCSAPSPLYIEAEGVEALAGVSTSFDLEVAQAVTFRLEAPKGVRLFQYHPFPTAFQADGEVFTNIDRLPHESGMLAEVTRARRQLEIERRSMMAQIRAETARAKATIRKASASDVPQDGGVAAEVPEAQPLEVEEPKPELRKGDPK